MDILLVVSALVIIAVVAGRAAIRRAAELRIEAAGGVIMYSHELTGELLSDKFTWHGPITRWPTWLVHVVGKSSFYRPMCVAISSEFSSENVSMITAIELLSRFPTIQGLHLNGACIGDEEAHAVGGVKALRCLRLEGTSITDAGLSALSGLSRLEEVQLVNNERISQQHAISILESHDIIPRIRFEGNSKGTGPNGTSEIQ